MASGGSYYQEGSAPANRTREKHVNGYGCCLLFLIFLILVICALVFLIIIVVKVDQLRDMQDRRLAGLETKMLEHSDYQYEKYAELEQKLENLRRNPVINKALLANGASPLPSETFLGAVDFRMSDTVCRESSSDRMTFVHLNGDNYIDLACLDNVGDFKTFYMHPASLQMYDFTSPDDSYTRVTSGLSPNSNQCPPGSRLTSGAVTLSGRQSTLCVDTGDYVRVMDSGDHQFDDIDLSGTSCGENYRAHFGDVSGDGKDDLVCVRSAPGASNDVVVALNRLGAATVFSRAFFADSAQASADCFEGLDSTRRFLMDAHSEGKQSLFCYNPTDGSLSRLTFTSSATRESLAQNEFTLPEDCEELLPATLDRDQNSDLICIKADNTLWIGLGSEDGWVWVQQEQQKFCSGDGGYEWYAEDFNGDGLTDLLCVEDYSTYYFNFAGISYKL